jgi:hypothetical protein
MERDVTLIYRLETLEEEVNRWHDQLDQITQEMTEIREKIRVMVEEAAERHLVDEAGQPQDGVLYWYTGFAVVRMGTRLELMKVKPLDEKEIWPATNGAQPAQVLGDMVEVI